MTTTKFRRYRKPSNDELLAWARNRYYPNWNHPAGSAGWKLAELAHYNEHYFARRKFEIEQGTWRQ